MKNRTGTFWHMEEDDQGILWLGFDTTGKDANVLSAAALLELDDCLRAIEQAAPAGLVIHSLKPGGFIAGADVREFVGIDDRSMAEAMIRRTHGVFARLESLPLPSVALIRGFCLGGGLELALACRYRIARDDESTRLGFPEVRLGLFPGYGGTVRSTRLIGPLSALNLMLGGRSISGRAAYRVGLVDLAVPDRQLQAAARKLITEQPPAHRPALRQRLLQFAPLRPPVAWYMKRQLAARVSQKHYPAPFALVDHWKRFATHPTAMYAGEAQRVAELLTGDTAQNLIRVFFLQERLKAQGKRSDFQARHVHVVGGGLMGGDIAAWCALRGLRVTLQDRAPEQLSSAMRRAHQLYSRKLRKARPVQAAWDRLTPDPSGYGARRADLVIEAIFENVDAKQALYRELEAVIRPDAVLATNTSSISLETLNTAMEQPERLVGVHFFNPVAKMQLVELVTAENTDREVARRAASFIRRIDRLPLPVASRPGFLVNRVLIPYLIEAVHLLEDKVPAPAIDRAATDFGMPMGPIALSDTIGLDVCLSVAEHMAPVLGFKVPDALRQRVEHGDLGRKTGRGFYNYSNHKRVSNPDSGPRAGDGELGNRLILPLLNEAMAALREGVVEDADLLDAGMVFGTGFAPFRGGPMHYIRSTGRDRLMQRLAILNKEDSSRYRLDEGWAAVED